MGAEGAPAVPPDGKTTGGFPKPMEEVCAWLLSP